MRQTAEGIVDVIMSRIIKNEMELYLHICPGSEAAMKQVKFNHLRHLRANVLNICFLVW